MEDNDVDEEDNDDNEDVEESGDNAYEWITHMSTLLLYRNGFTFFISLNLEYQRLFKIWIILIMSFIS